MPTLGTIYTYVCASGTQCVAICSGTQGNGSFYLSVLVNPGEALFAQWGPVACLADVIHDPTGMTPNSYH